MAEPDRSMHEVDVILVDLDRLAEERAPMLAVLSAEEQRRAARLARPRDAMRARASRAALRHLLADRIGTPPAAIGIETGQHGKPRLMPGHGAALELSVAHAGATALIAFCPTAPVGVDVEHVAPDGTPVPTGVLAGDETRLIASLIGPQRQLAFHRTWVRKEAILKAVGLGLSVDPVTIEVPVGEHAVCRPVRLPAALNPTSSWTLLACPVSAMTVAAAAVPRASARLREIMLAPWHS